MKYLKFQEWFYGLPIWEELDNYVYFGLAAICLFVLEIDTTAKGPLIGGLVGALLIKGRGSVKK